MMKCYPYKNDIYEMILIPRLSAENNESLLFFTLVLANEIIERKKDQQTKYIYVGLIEKHTYSSSEFQLDISLR